MTIVRTSWIFTVFILVGGGASAQTADHLTRELSGVDVVERFGAELPRQARFHDDQGRSVTFESYAGRPLLLSLNYSDCPMLCSLQLGGIARALKELPRRTGDRFEVITISIDPSDGVAQARALGQAYARQARRDEEDVVRWHFWTGPRRSIDAVARAVGFSYRFDPETKEFRHKATLVVVSPQGRVSSYLHGISYPIGRLREALDRAHAGQIASARDSTYAAGFLLNCFNFDPQDHTPLALAVMRASGLCVFVFLVLLIGVYGTRELIRKRRVP